MEVLAQDKARGEVEVDQEVLISVDDVSKKFCRHLRRSMVYGLLELS